MSGTHEWEEKMLEETGGDFILLHVRPSVHTSLRSVAQPDPNASRDIPL